MNRIATLVFAGLAYLLFLATFLYLVAFVGDLPWVPLTLDRGPVGPAVVAVVVDIALITLFALQHSIMARPWFKQSWTRIVPPAAERSAYVLLASLVLILLFVLWRPIPGEVWHVRVAVVEWLVWGLFFAGWVIALVSTWLISHFELFGLQQAWLNLKRLEPQAPRFHTPLFYRFVRHPLYLGFVIAFWAAPVMTWGHLLFAAVMTGYIFVAVYFEERDLTAMFGDEYTDYTGRVGKMVPRLRKTTA